jgi:hypothetical protein
MIAFIIRMHTTKHNIWMALTIQSGIEISPKYWREGFQTFKSKDESSGRNVISFSFDEEGSFFELHGSEYSFV